MNSSSEQEAFPITHWSLVQVAGSEPGTARARALSALLAQYLPPLRAHLRYRRSVDRDRAEDVLQSFVTDKVLQQELLSRAESGKGKFRTFLLAALDNYLFNQLRDAKAQKRAPKDLLSLDAPEEGMDAPDVAPGPDAAFDLAWAMEVLDRAIARMRHECLVTKRPDIWGVFEGRTLRVTLAGEEPMSYAELVRQFNFSSPSQASNVLITANRMFARLLRQVVGRYEKDPAAIDGEIADLRVILSTARAG